VEPISREPFLRDPDVTLWQGDVLDVLRDMPDESVDCVVTSPPYW
jgi:predicted methyltransferase